MQDKFRLYRRPNGMFYAEEYQTRVYLKAHDPQFCERTRSLVSDAVGRICVVELDCYLLREVFPVIVRPRKRRMMSLSEQATKKYCWTRRSSFPLSGKELSKWFHCGSFRGRLPRNRRG
jgi:hypothetical protein